MKILVTGATGFLGSRTADLLEERGHEIVRLARPGGRPRTGADETKLVRLDAGDPEARALLAGCAGVLHFAGVPNPTAAAADPARAVRENAGTVLNLLEGCLEHGCGLVYPSTTRVLVEPAPDIYAMSKRLGEEICRIHSAPATVVRLTSVFGPGQVASEGATGAIASFAAAALAAEPITIPGDPNRTRDFVLADDLAPMFERIVADGIWNETFTAARGETASLLETADLVRAAAGTEIEIRTPGGDLAPGENESYEADPPPARLGLELRPLKEGIELLCRLALTRYASMNDAPREVRTTAVPLLKAAPDAAQIAERLADGPWRGLEIALMPQHVADDAATQAAIEAVKVGTEGLTLTAEAPVSWPSGAFVSVDQLTDEARGCIVRSADFAAAIGSPVLTIHLYAPVSPEEFRTAPPLDDEAIQQFLRFYALTCLDRGVTPLIENVPPVLRMRVGGVFLSQVGGHWRDLRRWHARVPELRFTFDTSHAALFRNFATSYGSLFGVAADEELGLETYVEELAPALEVAHVSDAHGLLGEGLPIGSGELDLAPVMRRLGELCKFVVSEINEPDPARSPDMKVGYRLLERSFNEPTTGELARPPRRLPPEGLDWATVLERRDPVPALLELQERFGGRRVLITGGAGSIGRQLTTFLGGFRPERITLVDGHEAGLTADRRSREAAELKHTRYVLADVRDTGRIERLVAEERSDVIFHLAAYKHVDWAELYPDEFVDTNLQGSWNVLRAADHGGVDTVIVASTDKAALATSFYGRTKRLMEQLTAFSAREAGARRAAVRLVNVLGSAGSVSELFVRQARAGLPLTVTDAGMVRYWISTPHAAALVAQSALLAAEGAQLTTAGDATTLTVGELAGRIWKGAGRSGTPDIDVVGIRPGEVMAEVLVGPGETLAGERYQGVTAIEGEIPTAAPSFALEHLPENGSREENRVAWNQALSRPGLLHPVAR